MTLAMLNFAASLSDLLHGALGDTAKSIIAILIGL